MYDSIKEIWEGKLFPDIDYCVNKEKIIAAHRRNAEIEERLFSLLSDEDKAFFEDLLENYNDLIDFLREDSFTKGFKLASRIFTDALK